MIWLITRHAGAVEWARQQGLQWDRHEPHLDVAIVSPGDEVYGSLPVHLAAAICRQGARYWHLRVGRPVQLRGQELTAEQLAALGACFEGLHVQNVEQGSPDGITHRTAG